MMHPFIIVTLLIVLPLCTADSLMQLDEESNAFRILLKRIGELEENVRKSDRKLEEIPILKKRLDDAERRLTQMLDLQNRLEKSEEKIYELENRVKEKNCDASKDAFTESNVTKEDMPVDSVSRNAWVPRSVSTTMFIQAGKIGNVENYVLFKKRTKGDDEQTSASVVIIVEIMMKEKTERSSIPSRVAFTAMFSSHPIQLMPGRALLFDRVDYNEGNAYDKTSGIMTCPVSGTYFFYTNILNAPGDIAATEITHEGIFKGRTYGNSNYDQGSFSATLHCRAGERVWVRVSFGTQIYGGDHSSFTGFLLWADADSSISN
ncbi:hypothetical protein CHS0354_001478 [Potamilus streckersoni]|uniref:C1q domain-containing protein n=1 Tax=Potamilus streckersoni TaxID=2493646 RepID=A0AAE0W8Y3_9BIVA|nr:hypothetical protein CHS0354_001478 [Potamilus streckersoni]